MATQHQSDLDDSALLSAFSSLNVPEEWETVQDVSLAEPQPCDGDSDVNDCRSVQATWRVPAAVSEDDVEAVIPDARWEQQGCPEGSQAAGPSANLNVCDLSAELDGLEAEVTTEGRVGAEHSYSLVSLTIRERD